MNPLLARQKAGSAEKPDLSAMSEEEKKLFEKYGKLPKKNVLSGMQKERKYFDSGDYMMNKAGVKSENVGTAIPTPEHVQHASPPSLSSSPTKTGGPASLSGMLAAGQAHPSTSSNPSISGSTGGGSALADRLSTSPSTPLNPNPPLSPRGSFALPPGSDMGPAGRRASINPNGGVGVGAGSFSGGISIPQSGSFKGDGSRISPPISFSPLGSGVNPSSFPIQSSHHQPHPNNHHSMHHSSGSAGGHGSSPVKPSGLAIGSSGTGTDGIDEMAVEDAEA